MFKFSDSSYDDIANVRVTDGSDFDGDFTSLAQQSTPTASPHKHNSANSPPTSSSTSYNTFGSLSRGSDDRGVTAWLRLNNFDEKCIAKLAHYTGADLLSLSKEDIRELLGAKDGIRLHARLSQVREALSVAGHDPSMEKLQLEKVLAEAAVLASPKSRGYSKDHDSSETYQRPYISEADACERMGCRELATVKCCVETCLARLCAEHSHKDILTGYWYCLNCADSRSYTKRITDSRLHDVICKIQ